VAVCLWDPALGVGGMNHYIKPSTFDKGEATPQFGNVAIAALVRIMEEAGSERANLMAQVLGGGAPPAKTGKHIGVQNVEVARDMLRRKDIPIIAEDVGGTIGRKIAFDTGTGQLAVLKVHELRDSDWRV
jgi:chemotaxis protein CheD